MKILSVLGSGLAGALALTLLHESARRAIPTAPRMDILGMRAITKTMDKVDQDPPAPERLHGLALAGDIAANAAYYSLVAVGPANDQTWLRGAALGLLGGLGGVFLPAPMGLGSGPSGRTRQTQVMTVLWYLAGGLAAAGVKRLFDRLEGQGRL